MYNPDEARHFVARAVDFHLTGDLNPRYFINPPLVTYVFWAVFGLWFGGSDGVAATAATDPAAPYLVARVTIALISACGLIVMFVVGRRLFDNRVGLIAASLMAVAFLPVHWSHYATNDVAAMVAATVSLLGSVSILRSCRLRSYLVAGLGLGLACGTKYTAGIMLLPLLAAAFFHWRSERDRAVLGLIVAGAASVVTFLLTVPPLLFDTQSVLNDLSRLNFPGEGDPKIGQAQESGHVYYSWVLTWGLGWLACASAVLGAVWLVLKDRRVALLLIPAPIAFVLFMGGQSAFFGRWLLSVFPIVVLLAAFGAVRLADALPRPLGWSPIPMLTALTVLLCLQSAIHVVQMNRLLGQTDTRTMAAEWLRTNIPHGEAFVNQGVLVRPELDKNPSTPEIENDWEIIQMGVAASTVRALPRWIDRWERQGVCWISASSLFYDRVLVDEHLTPGTAAYYRELDARGEVRFRAWPYRPGAEPVPFNFDWATNLYPFVFERPGGEVIIYQLRGGECADG